MGLAGLTEAVYDRVLRVLCRDPTLAVRIAALIMCDLSVGSPSSSCMDAHPL